MKPIVLILLLLTVFACSPDFHKQKYTNFGHRKAVKLKTGIFEEEKNTTRLSGKEESPISNLETESNLQSSEHSMAEHSMVKDSVLALESAQTSFRRDSLSLVHIGDTLKINSVSTADSLGSMLYSRQLKREATRNLMLGAAEIAIGILAFLLLPYWLPILVIHIVVGVIFILVASHKIAKSNEVLKYPGRHKNPAGTHRIDDTVFRLSHAGYILLFLSIVISLMLISIMVLSTSLLFAVLAVIALLAIPSPLFLVALILLLIAGIKGRNNVREENLQDLPPNDRTKVYNVINWSLVAVAFTTAVTAIFGWFHKE